MLRSSIQAASPEIQALFDEIVNEETRFIMSERRDATRKPITRRVLVHSNRQTGQNHFAFSRDISNQGVGLVSQEPTEVGVITKLEIDRLNGRPSIVVAECRWCDEFAKGWFVTGWNFKRLERS